MVEPIGHLEQDRAVRTQGTLYYGAEILEVIHALSTRAEGVGQRNEVRGLKAATSAAREALTPPPSPSNKPRNAGFASPTTDADTL
jgi:hypothetical protein